MGLPLSALLLAELLLRLIGFGHPCTFFLRQNISGNAVLVDNPWVGWRFFPPALARSPNPVVMRVPKPAYVYRIFLFGESAALGEPRPAYGIGRYLETLLRRRFPGTEFEVIPVAMTAINSHALLPLARECAHYQGDLWILYMGNNEFVGPFGASTVFGPQAPPCFLVRAYLQLQQTRVGQGLAALTWHFHRADTTPTTWGGLKMFLEHQLSPADPRKKRVYENFAHNLNDILRAGIDSGVPIILSSVACNLKDCAPFGSRQPGGLDPSSLERWERICEQGATNLERGDFAAALNDYQKAVGFAPQNAELQFRLGECFLAWTNLKAAAVCFAQARDWDTLPFRADAEVNRTIARTAERYAGKGVSWVDAESILAPLSPGGIPGKESFYEHVHLNFNGNYHLALAFADEVARRLPGVHSGGPGPAWATPEVCARDLGLTDWNRTAALEEIGRRLSEAPFTNQLGQVERLRELRAQVAEIKTQLQPDAVAAARLLYEEALQRRPRDHWLRHNYAEFLTAMGDLAEASAQMRAVCDLLPYHYAAWFQSGRLLVLQKRYDEARLALKTAAGLRPDVADIHLELGQVYARQAQWDEALKQYSIVQQRQPENAAVRLLQAQVLEKQNKRAEAIRVLREAVRLRSVYCEARDLLGIELGLDGKIAEAANEFAEEIRIEPDKAVGHLNLGLALVRQERYDEAIEQFQIVLRLEPQNVTAREYVANLGQIQRPQAHRPAGDVADGAKKP